METNESYPINRVLPVRIGSATVHIGTSGWHYKHWLGDFYPPKFPPAKMLQWYAREFHTVEINNSFYRLPDEKTFREWAARVPPGFLFAVKASRFLTHMKRLKDAKDPIDLFFWRARHLGPHLGPVLFQLPPKWKADPGRLRDFLDVLPKDNSYAVEFRDDTWYTQEIFRLLQQHNVALCLHDWHTEAWAQELTANSCYIRFHGTSGRYAGNYPDHLLQDWASKIRGWANRLTNVYAYFNNDVGGHAIRNARSLRAALSKVPDAESGPGKPRAA